MTKPRKPNFSPEFRLEAAQLVIEQNYSVAEAAEAMFSGDQPGSSPFKRSTFRCY